MLSRAGSQEIDHSSPEGSLAVGVARWYRPTMIGLTLGLVAILAMRLVHIVVIGDSWGLFGVDRALYKEAALRWLAGGSYFQPHQLVGRYDIAQGDVLYPPIALYLLVPFAFAPDVLWYAVPIVLLARTVLAMRPAPWAWPLILAPFALAYGVDPYWLGQPTIWLPPLVALGLMRGGWGALALLKPSLLPFAFAGANRRTWWITLGLLAVAAIPFGSLWLDWLRAVFDSSGGLLYSLGQVPLLCVPVVAWLARDQRRERASVPSMSIARRFAADFVRGRPESRPWEVGPLASRTAAE